MHPYIIEALATERVRSLHEEAAARRLARTARVGCAGRTARLLAAFRGGSWRSRAARPVAEPLC